MKREKLNWFDNVNQGNKENTRSNYSYSKPESRKQSGQLKMGKSFACRIQIGHSNLLFL